jgi:hypothetical protein
MLFTTELSKVIYLKIKGKAFIYDSNNIYWALRTKQHEIFFDRQRKLKKTLNKKCNICKHQFIENDRLEIDSIIPRFFVKLKPTVSIPP